MAELWRQISSSGDTKITVGFRCMESHIVGGRKIIFMNFDN